MQTQVYIDAARTQAQMLAQREDHPLPGPEQTVTIEPPPSNITSAQLLDHYSIIVDGGPLVLEFPLLFLREKGEGEHDVRVTTEDFQHLGQILWR